MDRVDIYWLHRDDPSRDVSEIMETLAGFVASGRVGALGASNWTPARIEEANRWAESQGLPGFAANQPGWAFARFPSDAPVANMRYMDDATLAWHRRTGLPAVPYSSQANGYFGAENVHWARNGFAGPPPRAESYDAPSNRARLLRAVELAERKGCTANQVAVAYLLSQPFPVHPIIGTTDPDHLEEAMGAPDIALSAGECAWLETGR
jgi:aryl-alcohol dehydrogenase-like predicted oxidoreductase